jgi:hypothetical protein
MAKSIVTRMAPELSENRRRMNAIDLSVEMLYRGYVRDVVTLRRQILRLQRLLAVFSVTAATGIGLLYYAIWSTI